MIYNFASLFAPLYRVFASTKVSWERGSECIIITGSRCPWRYCRCILNILSLFIMANCIITSPYEGTNNRTHPPPSSLLSDVIIYQQQTALINKRTCLQGPAWPLASLCALSTCALAKRKFVFKNKLQAIQLGATLGSGQTARLPDTLQTESLHMPWAGMREKEQAREPH